MGANTAGGGLAESGTLSVSATAPGKVNLYFEVGDRRADGYHDVASLYAAVSLRERVTVTAGSGPGIGLSLDIAAGSALAELERSGMFSRDSVPLDERNLAHRAAVAVLEAQGVDPSGVSLHLHIEKEVPVAGGMAGGSADAAAALKAVNRYTVQAGWVESPLPAVRLRELGAGLGADVPFCLLGGIAVGGGAGEKLTPLSIPHGTQPLELVMLLNERGLETPAVFGELDRGRAEGRYPQPRDLPRVPVELAEVFLAGGVPDPRGLAGLIRNDLQQPALYLAPELGRRLTALPAGAVTGFVSGSGPTLAMLLDSENPPLDGLNAQKLGGVPVFCRLEYGREELDK